MPYRETHHQRQNSFNGRYPSSAMSLSQFMGRLNPYIIRRFSLSLHPMKLIVLIFSFLLSFLSAGRIEVTASSNGSQCNVSACQSSAEAVDYTQNKEICITAAQGYAFAGSNSTNSVSVRTTQSFRRLNQPVRSSFRIVKGGKIIDNNHLHPFLAQSFVHLAGIYISERYLLSICRLRL